MDRVRLGRALGYGARHAAKTLMAAADAAAAPGPSAKPSSASGSGPAAPRAAAPAPSRPAVPRPSPISSARVAAASTQASASGRTMVSSVKRLSGAVMLQVIGTFFALFAFTFGGAVWRLRAAFRLPPGTPEAHKLYAALLMCAVFGYFTASSFLRARKLEKP